MVEAATRTASVTGNWDNTATWGGAAVPVSGDIVNINGNIVVTIPAGYAAASNLIIMANTANTSGIATLVINGTLTLSQYLVVGNGSGKDGKLILGPDSVFTFAEFDLRNGYLLSSGTTRDHPAKLSGGYINSDTVGSRQVINLSFVNFVSNNGLLLLRLDDTTGLSSGASSLTITNCTFYGWGGGSGITFGSSSTPNSTPMSISNSDFRNFGSGVKRIIVQRTTGGSATYEFIHNTIDHSPVVPPTTVGFNPQLSGGLIVDGNVFSNAQINTASTSSVIATNNFFTTQIAVLDNGLGSTISRNYQSPVINNAGGVNMIGSVGTGTHAITYNVMEGQSGGGFFTNIPDFVLPAVTPLPINLSFNLLIGGVELFVGHGATTPPDFSLGVNVKNNTIAGKTLVDGAASGHIFVPEGPANPGTLNIANNLHRGNSVDSAISNPGASIGGSQSGGPEVITYSDYNNFFNQNHAYSPSDAQLLVSNGNTSKIVPGSHDTVIDPQFFDETRDLITWNASYGSGVATQAAGITYLLGINGYRGSPNYDQNGTISAYTPSDLLDWVRYGYAPTNIALRAAGDPSDGSPDIGAVPFLDIVAPTVTAFDIPATSSSLTVSINTFTATDAVGVTGYKVTESSSAPAYDAAGWTSSAPANYTFSTEGSKTLYAWAKDADGNVSTSLNDSITVTLDSNPPTITNVSSDKANGTYGIGEVIDIDVTFSEAVTSTGNVTVNLDSGGSCTFTVSNSTTGTCNYTVGSGQTSADLTVSSISGTIADQASNPMSNFTPATNLAANKAIVIDTSAPAPAPTTPNGNGGLTTGYISPSSTPPFSTTPSTSNPPTTSGCNDTSGFSTITGQSCANNSTSTPTVILGCGVRTSGFSTVTGMSCIGNTGTVSSSSSTYNLGSTTLRLWSKGEAVKELQRFLNTQLNLTLVVDGKLGPKTTAAVKKWQALHGLVADGVVGPLTKAKMGE